jgi:protein associated with RNAse G/E
MVDLDLDVSRARTGVVKVHDEDEFACHQVRYRYPAELIAQAERAADWLRRALTENQEPFATVYLTYLALLAELRGNGQVRTP